MRSTVPLSLALMLALASPTLGQYSTGFESLAGQPAGVPISDTLAYAPGTIPCPQPLPTQDCFYIPAGTPHSGFAKKGTRTIHCFGGTRA